MGGGLARYLLGRLLGLLLVVFAVTLFTFFLMHRVPGGPFTFDKQPLPPFAILPNFIIGFLLIFILRVHFHLLPTGGWGSPKQLIMTVIAYALGPLAVVARYTRSSKLEVLRSEYVRWVRARGIPRGRILRRYVQRNALIPPITVSAPPRPTPSPAPSSSSRPSPCPASAASSPPAPRPATTR